MISAILITKNNVQTIDKTLYSLILQRGLDNYQVLIFDKGSNDGTLTHINTFKCKYPSILKNITNKDINEDDVLQYCIKKANSERVIIIDPSSYLLNLEIINIQNKYLNTHKELNGVCTKYITNNVDTSEYGVNNNLIKCSSTLLMNCNHSLEDIIKENKLGYLDIIGVKISSDGNNTKDKIKSNSNRMEIVYVFDKNYIRYFNISVKSLLRFHPDAHITIVSNEKLKLPYDVVVMKQLNNMKHRENDRITTATFLKLQLPKLPYDKILFIDADVICQHPLTELWNSKCDYISLTESHSYGEIQAKEHNHDKYGLSGVMLMNLKALREDNFIEKALVPFDTTPFKLWCHEETIINHYFYDKLTFIDKKYNYCHNRTYKDPISENDAVLLHYCGGNKSDMIKRQFDLIKSYSNLDDIKRFIKNKKVAIVGNAASIFSKNDGNLIDTFDVVIRFTFGIPTDFKSQGSKTDIAILAEVLADYQLKMYNARYYINRMKRVKNETPYHFLNDDIVKVSKNLNARASSGLLAIDLCVKSGCKSIDLFGFDWEKTPTFYNPIGYKTQHNYNSEERIVKKHYSSLCKITIH